MGMEVVVISCALAKYCFLSGSSENEPCACQCVLCSALLSYCNRDSCIYTNISTEKDLSAVFIPFADPKWQKLTTDLSQIDLD